MCLAAKAHTFFCFANANAYFLKGQIRGHYLWTINLPLFMGFFLSVGWGIQMEGPKWTIMKISTDFRIQIKSFWLLETITLSSDDFLWWFINQVSNLACQLTFRPVSVFEFVIFRCRWVSKSLKEQRRNVANRAQTGSLILFSLTGRSK